jgi:oligopeptide/dipeptide ABC transporter ATP-binding protein
MSNLSQEWLLKVDDLSVHFKTPRGIVQAVDHISFDIKPGETLALVGETGCGKSVTARSILKLVPHPQGRYASGSITLKNQSTGTSIDMLTAPLSEVRATRGNRIAMIFQDPGKALNPSLTIGQQLAEVFGEHRVELLLNNAGLDQNNLPVGAKVFATQKAGFISKSIFKLSHRKDYLKIRKSIDSAVEKALADTGIPNPKKVMSRYPHELSGGMKQRVMIAQALACDPDLLIADEPTTALDVTIQARILDLIKDIQTKRGTAILYITHDLSIVRQFADRLAVMYAGRIVEIGPALEVLANPQHPYTQGLLGAIPKSTTPRGKLAAIAGSVPQLIDPPAQCHFQSRCQWSASACTKNVPHLTDLNSKRQVACLRFGGENYKNIPINELPSQLNFTELNKS